MNSQDDIEVQCPYCGQLIVIMIDCSIERQQYVEDCHVCCQPILLDIEVDDEGVASLLAVREND